jgi:hypothetical protein
MKHAGLLLGCLLLISSSALLATAQSRNNTGAVTPQFVAEPIKVTTPLISARNRSWTTQPLVQVENISTKPIQYFTIEAKLPGASAPFMLAYGQQPGHPATASAELLKPGAKITLSVDGYACDAIKKRLLEIDARSLAGNHATARINGVVFNDRTAWFDGLPHVMEPNNPRRWNVVRSTATTAPTDSPMFSFLNVGFRANNNAKPNYDMCWDRLGTEYVDCCGFAMASAILVQVWGGIFEPFPMFNECAPGVFCEWTKALLCRDPTF